MTGVISKSLSFHESGTLARCEARLALFDVDGTLRNADGVITPNVVRSIRLLRESGCRVGLATGRPLFSARAAMQQIGVNAPSIVMAGAAVVDHEGALIHSAGIQTDLVVKLIHAARDCGIDIEIVSLDEYFAERLTDLLSIHVSYHPKPPQMVSDLVALAPTVSVLKASLILDPEHQRDDFSRLCARLPELCFSVAHGAAHPHLYFVNATSREASIAVAFNHVLSVSELSSRDVISFGDGASDIPLMRLVTTSVAMGNAVPEAQEVATWVTKSVHEDGVAFALSRLFELPL